MAKEKKANRKRASRDARPNKAENASSPQDLPELRQARALWAENRRHEAVALFDRAARKHADNYLALVDAGRAFGAMYQFDRAEYLLDRAAQLAQGRADVLYLVGQSYRLIRRPEKAIECFRAAVATGRPPSEVHLELALLFERCNQLDRALEHTQRRLRRRAADDEGRWVQGRILRRQGAWKEAERLLREVATRHAAHWMTRMRAWAELATLLDAQQDYAQAWEAIEAGKKIGRNHSQAARRHRDKLMARLRRLAAEATRDGLAGWEKEPGDPPPRLALLTGMPRSGTTLLARLLNAHPQLVACDEFDAFARYFFPAMLGPVPLEQLSMATLDALPDDQLTAQRQQYAACLWKAVNQTPDGRMLVDKNPSLLPLLVCYRRLAPGSRLLIAIRDPRDVLVSCLMSYLPLNDFSVDFLSLETAVARIREDLELWLMLRERLAGGWIEVKYEALVSDAQAALGKMLRLMDLNWDAAMLDEHPSSGMLINSPSYDSAAQPIYTHAIGRWQHYAPQLAKVLPQLREVIEGFGYRAN